MSSMKETVVALSTDQVGEFLEHYDEANETKIKLGNDAVEFVYEDETWIAVNEGVTNGVLRDFVSDSLKYQHTQTNHFITMFYESNATEETSTKECNHYTFFKKDFMKAHAYELISFLMSHRKSEDCDVKAFLNESIEYFDCKSKEYKDDDVLSFVDYFVYLRLASNASNLFYVRSSDSIVDVNEVDVHQTMFSVSLMVRGSQYFLAGKGVLHATVTTMIPMKSEYIFGELDVCPVSEEDKDRIYNRNVMMYSEHKPSRYALYSGVGYEYGMFGNLIPHNISNHRVVSDIETLSQTNMDEFSSLGELCGAALGNTIEEIQSMSNDMMHILSNNIMFFDLEKKMWLLGSNDNLSAIQFRDDAFGKVIMDDTHKSLISAMVGNHSVENTDFIDGKGSNAIFLLHGVPGTGKTLTAEAVAEMTHKPLYKVSLGELGIDVDRLEEGLKQILTIAERWDAILLIDEADVFLEKRNSSDLNRNAMVAVFLRLLEYYEGIMFLTTNRALDFDEAFVSRITLAIEYKQPDAEKLWSALLEHSSINISNEHIQQLAASTLNGRQVKNCINSAKSLAAYESVEVEMKHIKLIMNETEKFNSFMSA